MEREMNLSDEALGAIMMALQKCILEQVDITEILKGFRFKNSEEGLVILNPPIVKFEFDDEEENK